MNDIIHFFSNTIIAFVIYSGCHKIVEQFCQFIMIIYKQTLKR